MSAPLTAEEEARYTEIIDGILAVADLQTVTRKLIRQGLQDATQTDLSAQKNAIKSLIEARFDAISERDAEPTPPEGEGEGEGADGYSYAKANGCAPPDNEEEEGGEEEEEEEEEAGAEIKVSLPPAKKLKREKSSEDADARLAAELQAQEDRLAQGRSTRGGSAGKPVKKAKVVRKRKKEKHARGSDESDDPDGGTKVPRKARGGLAKPFNLSVEMQELTGETQVVKKIWDHIKANGLQDPNNKRDIVCDDKMQAVFRTSKVNMFKMNKHIGNHLYEVEAATDA